MLGRRGVSFMRLFIPFARWSVFKCVQSYTKRKNQWSQATFLPCPTFIRNLFSFIYSRFILSNNSFT